MSLIKKLQECATIGQADPILTKLNAGPAVKKLVETAIILSNSPDQQQRNHAYSFMESAIKELEDEDDDIKEEKMGMHGHEDGLNNPTIGDEVSVDVYNYSGTPTNIIGGTGKMLIPSSTAQWYTMPMELNPIPVTPGTYFLGVNETFDFNITLGTTPFNFQPNVGWVEFPPGTGFFPTESFGFFVTYLLRANFGSAAFDTMPPDTNFIGENILASAYSIFPNPTNSEITIDFDLPNQEDVTITIYNSVGELVMRMQRDNMLKDRYVIDLSGYSEGVYFVELATEDAAAMKRVVLMK